VLQLGIPKIAKYKEAWFMKKILTVFLATLLMLSSIMTLSGCDLLFGMLDDGDTENSPSIEDNGDLIEYTPTPNDDGEFIEGESYYTSELLHLVTEVNGNYRITRPFTIDKDDESKRIFHGVYLYEEDFLQVLHYKSLHSASTLYAVMSDEGDTEYAELEYTSLGTPLQINIKSPGIYDIILDRDTFGIDLVRVGDIQTPVYERIKSCELYVHISQSNYSYSEMTLNEQTNEYFIQKEIPAGASIGFFNNSHTGRYKTTVVPEISDRLVYWNNTNPAQIQVHVGGTYNVYFNAKTYVLRLELQNPDTADYYCQVEFGQGNVLSPVSSDTPYLFEYEFTAEGTRSDPYVSLPRFYPELGMKYSLDLIGEVILAGEYVESGTYKLTVNLKDFTLTVEKIGE
jgi:hypothetical protein